MPHTRKVVTRDAAGLIVEIREVPEADPATDSFLATNDAMLKECIKRFVKIECEGLTRVLKQKAWGEMLPEFYLLHKSRMLPAVELLINQRKLLAPCCDAGQLIDRHIAESKSLLLEAFRGDSATATGRMKDCLEGFSLRAEYIISKLEIENVA